MKKALRIVFFGSGQFACPCLDAILAAGADEVAVVVTQPDRPRGRSLQTAPCALHMHVKERGIPVLTEENVNSADCLERLRALAPDLIVVVAFGQILRRALLDLPPMGCVNVHGSLLPRYRGAAPIQWAIARGETITGVTVMFMNERMDAGDILAQAREPVLADDTGGTLHDRLAALGATLLVSALDELREGRAVRRPQDHALATFAPMLKKADGRLDWALPAKELFDRVRAFQPWPGCACEAPAGSKRLVKVLKASAETWGGAIALPGTVLETSARGPLVAAGAGALRLLEVQPESRKAMSGAAFVRGHNVAPGMRLG